MPKQALENLTEAMFYTLMALTRGDACGTEITAFAAEISGGAVRLGPATLYTLLAKFEKEGFLTQAGTVGTKGSAAACCGACKTQTRQRCFPLRS